MHTVTSIVQGAGKLEDWPLAAQALQQHVPDQLVVGFAELYARRARLLNEAGRDGEAAIEKWIDRVLWDTAHGSDEFRVLPDAGSVGADPMADWRGAPVEAFARIWEVASGTEAPAPIKAILAQVPWELRALIASRPGQALPRPIDALHAAVEGHVQAAKWYEARDFDSSTRGMLITQHWKTAARLSSEVGQPDLLHVHLGELRAAQSTLDEAPHWALALIEVELSLATVRNRRRADLVTDARLEELLPRLGDITAALDDMGHMGHVQSMVLDARARIECILGRGPDQQEIAKRRALLHEKDAQAASSMLIASGFWKKAAAEYQQAGMRDEAARAKEASRDAIRHALEEEFTEVVVPLNLDQADAEKLVEPYFSGASDTATILRRVAARLFAPSLERPSATPMSAPSIAAQIAMTVPIVDDRSLAEIPPDSDERRRFDERRTLLTELVIISEVVIAPIFKRLRDDHALHAQDLVVFLAASPHVEVGDLPFLRTGAERYLRGDRISAMHILVPRVEQVVRRLLKAAGAEVTALRDGELRERTLGELLRDAESKGLLSVGLIGLLRAVLSEEWGLNLRNRIAHGLATDSDCSEANMSRIIQLTLHLAMVHVP